MQILWRGCCLSLLLLIAGCGLFSPPAELTYSIPSDPLPIDFTGYTLRLQNTGAEGSILEWRIDSSVDWLGFNPTGGKIEAGQQQNVTLSLAEDVGRGPFVAPVTVTGGGKMETFRVQARLVNCTTTSRRKQRERLMMRSFSPVVLDPPGAEYVSNQVIVHYKTPSALEMRAVHDAFGLRSLSDEQTLGAKGVELVELPHTTDPIAASRALSADPRVAFAQPNYYYYPKLTPNDSLYPQQWTHTGFGMQEAWDISTGSVAEGEEPVIIAIIDTSVQGDHLDLQGKVLPGCDVYNGDNVPFNDLQGSVENYGHGTHVAGIAAALGNNSLGIAGVAYHPDIKILPVQTFDDGGERATSASVARGIRWASGIKVPGFTDNANPAQILNLSLGTKRVVQDETLDQAVAEAREAGALVIAASGNESSRQGIISPANSPGVLAVGSIDSNLLRSSFSNYDASGDNTVDIMAPGGAFTQGFISACLNSLNPDEFFVLSTWPLNNYDCRSGTSAASPFVAGVAALVWSQNRDWTAEKVKQQLLSSTLYRDSWTRAEYGQGLLCADRALGATTLCGRVEQNP